MGDTLALILRLAAFFLTTLVLLLYVGYGPTAVLLPATLRRYGWLLMPGIGYCWFVLAASLLNSTVLPMTWATAVILVAATLANGWARRRLPPRQRNFPFFLREHGVVAALAAVPYLLGVLPLLNAGSTAFVGLQWDLEVYLPITEYLKRYAIGSQLVAPANPLLTSLNALDFRGGSGWGFSYLEAGVGLLLGWPSYLTFRPLLVAALCLSVPGWYVLAVHTLKTGRAAALLAAGLWSLQGLSLWIASMGLAGHTVTYGILPLALLLTAAALTTGDRRAIVLAGSAVAGLVLSFYTGSLPFYVLPTSAWTVVLLVRGPQRLRTVGTVLGIGVAALVLAPVAHLRFLQAMTVYGDRGLTQGWNVAMFSPVAEALGLSPFVLVQETARAADLLGADGLHTYLVGGWYLTLAAGAAALCGILMGRVDRWRWAGLALPLVALVVLLRWGLDYPYGYFKALSIIAPVLIITLAVGVVALWRSVGRLGQRRFPHPGPFPEGEGGRHPPFNPFTGNRTGGVGLVLRGGLLILGVLFLVCAAMNTALSLRYFWKQQPDELPRMVWELSELQRRLPPGAPVYVLGRSGFDPRTAGMVAYFLIDHPLSGNLETAYRRITPPEAGQRLEYILFLDGVGPEERGLRADEALWRNGLVSLYRAPERWAGALEFEGLPAAVEVARPDGVTLSLKAEGWQVQGGNGPAFAGVYQAPVQDVEPELTILTFGPTEFEATRGDSQQMFTLGPGIHSHRVLPGSVPGDIHLRTRSGPPPVLLGARVLRLDAGPLGPGAPPSEQLVALRPSLQVAGSQLTADVTYNSPDPRHGTVTVALEVYRQDPRGGLRPYAAWELAQLHDERAGTARFTLDLEQWSCTGGREDTQPSPLGLAGFPPDGTYHLHLVVYHMGDQGARWPWLTLRSAGGRLEVVKETPLPPVLVTYLGVPSEVAALQDVIPTGATVLLVTDPDSDRTFVAGAAGFLPGRRLLAATGFSRNPVPPHAMGWMGDYALIAEGLDPRVFGYDSPPVWENDQARLYRRGPRDAQANFRFPNGEVLTPGASFRLTRNGATVQVDTPQGHSWTTDIQEEGPVDVEAVVASPSAGALVMREDAGAAVRRIPVPQGVSLVRLSSVAGQGSIQVQADDGSAVTIATVRVLSATGEPSGATALPGALVLRVSAASSVEGQTVRISMEGAAATAGAPLVLGVDVYNRGQCALQHYGYWAASVPPQGGAIQLHLEPVAKRGVLFGADDKEIPVDAATWPTGDGRYRAVTFLRQGERTRWVPTASFIVRDGAMAQYRPLAAGSLVVLR